MKETKVMLSVIIVFVVTWMLIAMTGWLLSDDVTYKSCMTHPATLMIMLIFGWIPTAVVGHDYWKHLNGQD